MSLGENGLSQYGVKKRLIHRQGQQYVSYYWPNLDKILQLGFWINNNNINNNNNNGSINNNNKNNFNELKS